MRPAASVVIPSYQGRADLPRVLDGLARQTRTDFETLVVVDGSRDGTGSWLARRAPGLPFPLRVLAQSNAGAAAARNRGAREARGDLLVFLGDDVTPDAFLVEAHLRAHVPRRPRVAVGVTAWHPAMPLTPFLRRIGPELTPYLLIRDPARLDYDFLYGSNLSLPRALALRFPFDSRFAGCGWEDTELGYRLGRAGVPLVLAPKALGWHWHAYTPAAWARRRARVRRAFVRFLGLYPEEGARLVAAHKAALKNRDRHVQSVLRQAESVFRENRERRLEMRRLGQAQRMERVLFRTDVHNLRMDNLGRLREIRRLAALVGILADRVPAP